MSWKIYGAMLPFGTSKQFGPLPKKRWVNQPGERYRVKHARPSYRNAGSSKEITEVAAIEYAKWLARRDGKAISDLDACAQWDVTALDAKRICAVLFGIKDRYRGTFKTEMRIAIPHWDFQAAEPIEHFDDELEGVFA